VLDNGAGASARLAGGGAALGQESALTNCILSKPPSEPTAHPPALRPSLAAALPTQSDPLLAQAVASVVTCSGMILTGGGAALWSASGVISS
jgi:hypothetical protein